MTKVRLDELKQALFGSAPTSRKSLSEADYKRKLVAEVNSLPGGYARRVEDRFAVGVLDMIIKPPERRLVFAEGKLIDGNLFAPTERQFHEGLRIQAANVECVLIGWKSGVMYVSPWVKEADYRNCFSIPGQPYSNILWEYLG